MRKMRALLLSAIVGFALVGCGAELTDTAYAEPELDQNVASTNVFYDALAPYGTWVDNGIYGWVWVPSAAVVGADFYPYASDGQWLDTDWGWYFASDYDWGWAPFHYGRWYFDTDMGWSWVPGTTWAPSWVDWRWGDGYVGWAPLPPFGGSVVRDHRSRWVFARDRDLTDRDIHRHLIGRDRARLAYRVTRPMDDEIASGRVRWHHGPPAGVVSSRERPVRRFHITPPREGVVVRGHVRGHAIVHQRFVSPNERFQARRAPRYRERAPREELRERGQEREEHRAFRAPHRSYHAIRGPVRMPMHPAYRAAPRRHR